MEHLGNDIISLKDKKNKNSFSNPRFLKKAFNEYEIDLTRRFELFDHLPFLIWTCKESAYKVMVKKGLRKPFCPVTFSVSINDRELKRNSHVSVNSKKKKKPLNLVLHGNVQYDKVNISTKSYRTANYIHTIAASPDIPDVDIYRGVKKIGRDELHKQSLYTRMYLIESLAKKLKTGKSIMTVFNHELTQVPFVQINHSTVDIDISLSHDTEFISYAYLLRDELY